MFSFSPGIRCLGLFVLLILLVGWATSARADRTERPPCVAASGGVAFSQDRLSPHAPGNALLLAVRLRDMGALTKSLIDWRKRLFPQEQRLARVEKGVRLLVFRGGRLVGLDLGQGVLVTLLCATRRCTCLLFPASEARQQAAPTGWFGPIFARLASRCRLAPRCGGKGMKAAARAGSPRPWGCVEPRDMQVSFYAQLTSSFFFRLAFKRVLRSSGASFYQERFQGVRSYWIPLRRQALVVLLYRSQLLGFLLRRGGKISSRWQRLRAWRRLLRRLRHRGRPFSRLPSFATIRKGLVHRPQLSLYVEGSLLSRLRSQVDPSTVIKRSLLRGLRAVVLAAGLRNKRLQYQELLLYKKGMNPLRRLSRPALRAHDFAKAMPARPLLATSSSLNPVGLFGALAGVPLAAGLGAARGGLPSGYALQVLWRPVRTWLWGEAGKGWSFLDTALRRTFWQTLLRQQAVALVGQVSGPRGSPRRLQQGVISFFQVASRPVASRLLRSLERLLLERAVPVARVRLPFAAPVMVAQAGETGGFAWFFRGDLLVVGTDPAALASLVGGGERSGVARLVGWDRGSTQGKLQATSRLFYDPRRTAAFFKTWLASQPVNDRVRELPRYVRHLQAQTCQDGSRSVLRYSFRMTTTPSHEAQYRVDVARLARQKNLQRLLQIALLPLASPLLQELIPLLRAAPWRKR